MTTETEMREVFEKILFKHFKALHQHWCGLAPMPSLQDVVREIEQAATLTTEARYAELVETIKEFLRADNLRTLNPGEVNEANRYQHAFFALNKALAKLEKGEQA